MTTTTTRITPVHRWAGRRVLATALAAAALAVLFAVLTGPAAGAADWGPDDLQPCTEDCGGDDGPPDWGPGGFEVCTEDCGGEDGGESGGEDGGESGGADGGEDGSGTPHEEIPVPTRIDTGHGAAASSHGHDLALMGAAAAAVGAALLTLRAVRDRR